MVIIAHLVICLFPIDSMSMALNIAHLTQCLVHDKSLINISGMNEKGIDQHSISGGNKSPSHPRAAFLFEMKAFSRLNIFLESHLIGQHPKH